MSLLLLLFLLQDEDYFAEPDIKVDFTETVTIVNLPLKIRLQGLPYKRLKLSDLVIIENGVEVEIQNLKKVEIPLTAHFLFDLSTSNERHILNAKKTVRDFSQKLRPGDRAKISFFSATYQPLTDYIADRQILMNKLGRLTPVGSTALYDGLSAALDELVQQAGARVLVLFSDGHDLLSRISETALNTKVKNYGIPIIFVSFDDRKKQPPLLAAQLRFMESLAVESGGSVVFGNGSFGRDLNAELRKQRKRHLVRFQPPGPGDLELWRSLTVKVRNCTECRLDYRRAYQIRTIE